MVTLYEMAQKTAHAVNAVVVPAIGKAPYRGLHPKHFAPIAGVPLALQSKHYWLSATGYCVAPFGGVVALDFDVSEALQQALTAVPALAHTTQVTTSKDVHLYVACHKWSIGCWSGGMMGKRWQAYAAGKAAAMSSVLVACIQAA